jgi:hypothetical protein
LFGVQGCWRGGPGTILHNIFSRAKIDKTRAAMALANSIANTISFQIPTPSRLCELHLRSPGFVGRRDQPQHDPHAALSWPTKAF